MVRLFPSFPCGSPAGPELSYLPAANAESTAVFHPAVGAERLSPKPLLAQEQFRWLGLRWKD